MLLIRSISTDEQTPDKSTEQALKKKKAESENGSEESVEESIEESIEASPARSDSSNSSTSDVAQPSTPAGSMIDNCQSSTLSSYPTLPPILHRTTPHYTTSPASPSLTPRTFMPPQYYLDRFLANHDRSEKIETQDDGLFVTQSPGLWMDGVARGYSHYH